jgi:hypothetical protein
MTQDNYESGSPASKLVIIVGHGDATTPDQGDGGGDHERYQELHDKFVAQGMDQDSACEAAAAACGLSPEEAKQYADEESDGEGPESDKSAEDVAGELKALHAHHVSLGHSPEDSENHAVAAWNAGNQDHEPLTHEMVKHVFKKKEA